MPHFFIKNDNITDDLVIIDDKENYQHIARSLRAKIGEKILMVNENRIKIEGKIVEICVEDGQPVEFGQVLMYVE